MQSDWVRHFNSLRARMRRDSRYQELHIPEELPVPAAAAAAAAATAEATEEPSDDSPRRRCYSGAQDKEAERATLEELRCPICFEVPWTGPVWSCSRGHTFCNTCKLAGDVKKCPKCRDENVNNRCLFAETVISSAFEDSIVLCRHLSCSFADVPKKVLEHEIECMQKPVSCAGYRKRAKCNWRGSLPHLTNHLEKSKCFEILYAQTTAKDLEKGCGKGDYFYSGLATNSQDYRGVFQLHSVVNFRPVALITPPADDVAGIYDFKFFHYLTIYRSACGKWYFQMKSYLSRRQLAGQKFRLIISPPHGEDSPTPAGPYFLQEGYLNPHGEKTHAIISSGNYLSLSDYQITKLAKGKNTKGGFFDPYKIPFEEPLFRYRIELFKEKSAEDL